MIRKLTLALLLTLPTMAVKSPDDVLNSLTRKLTDIQAKPKSIENNQLIESIQFEMKDIVDNGYRGVYKTGNSPLVKTPKQALNRIGREITEGADNKIVNLQKYDTEEQLFKELEGSASPNNLDGLSDVDAIADAKAIKNLYYNKQAIDLEGYYITAKGGVSKTSDTGVTSYTISTGTLIAIQNEDLGTGSAFGFSVGKYLTDSFRLELEATKRTGYEYDALWTTNTIITDEAKIQTEALFVNGFYDFQPFTMSNTAITPYLGGGVGISRNKMGTIVEHNNGLPSGTTVDGNTINQFAYKLSAGTLVSLTKQLSLDVNYQYVNLGAFKSGTELSYNGAFLGNLQRGINGGDIKTQELMVGLQYKF